MKIKEYVFGVFVILIFILNVIGINKYFNMDNNNIIRLINVNYDKEDINIKLINENLPIKENIEIYEVNKSKELSKDNNEKSNKDDVDLKKKSENQDKKVIVIDPGHGGNGNTEMELQSPNSNVMKIKDPGGASGINSGTPEYVIAWNVSLKLKSLLENEGYKVLLTKNSINESPGNIERAEVGNKNNAALEIRIHCDSADAVSAHGATMLVPSPVDYVKDVSSISKTYGEEILSTLVNEAGMYNRGISERSDLTGFNWSKVPVILIELGFLSNSNEEQLLISDEYENKLAKGLCGGIKNALSK